MKDSVKVPFAFSLILLWAIIAWRNLRHNNQQQQHTIARREALSWDGRLESTRFKQSYFLDDGYVSDTCQDTLVGNMLSRFTAIVFNDYTTNEAQGIIGPLAIKGKFTGGSFTINQGHTSGCQDETNLDGYGLVVGTTFAGVNTHVFGAAYLPTGTDTKQLEEQTSGCPIYTDRGTGLFDFDIVEQNFLYASKQFSTEPPSLQLDSNGKLTRIGQADSRGYDTVTFNTCSTTSQTCTVFSGQLSDPNAMLFGVGNWNGPQGMTWPEKTIFNIPVLAGSTITLAGNQLSLQVDPCNSIMNFYPSDADGNYVDGGTFTIRRETGGRVGGMILAPTADVLDSSMGSFAGQLISTNYGWESSGVFINDYGAAGGSCLNFAGCFPLVNITVALNDATSRSTSSQSGTSTSTSSSSSSSSTEQSSSSDEPSSTSKTSSDSSPSLLSSSELKSLSIISTESSFLPISTIDSTSSSSTGPSSSHTSGTLSVENLSSSSSSISDLVPTKSSQSSSKSSSTLSSTSHSIYSNSFTIASATRTIASREAYLPSSSAILIPTPTSTPTSTYRHFVGHRFYRHLDHYHDDTVYVCDFRDTLPEIQDMADEDWLDLCYDTFMNDTNSPVYVDIHPSLENDANFIYNFDFEAYYRE
ncbi:unnamed protein product [Mucor circinelloides]